ncbi:MAG: oxygen-dependent coproporphyrinogen oxidase [Nitrospirae bacterium]|nr:oxygen-dependent coproporphyrinogen oxidase [Nitrospirota bacterium]MBI3352414.1 oxygen-dependent coproporphyrinogen oxidase [Nitrospirota bacterium]
MRAEAEGYFQNLRDRICQAFESLDSHVFERTSWQRPGGGGGVMSVMKGKVFEKVGVNCSTVFGEMDPEFGKKIPGYKDYFFATGISLVAHMVNPIVSAFHMNLRYIETDHSWFGGGADMTPSIPIEEDITDFHRALKTACDKHDPAYYSRFKKWCDQYFYLEHRKEPRGSEGIFFDNLNQDIQKEFNFVKDTGEAFLGACPGVIKRRKEEPFTEEQKDLQLYKRGRYVEFNLLYDQGTLFGLKTGANVHAVLMSMPPVVKWK